MLYLVKTLERSQGVVYIFSPKGSLLDKEDYTSGDQDPKDETYEDVDPNKLSKEFLAKVTKHLGDRKFDIGREMAYVVKATEDDQELLYIFSPKGTLLGKK